MPGRTLSSSRSSPAKSTPNTELPRGELTPPASAEAAPGPALSFQKLSITPDEPLRLEIEAFLHSVRTRQAPAVPAQQSREALAAALAINQEIADHRRRAGLH